MALVLGIKIGGSFYVDDTEVEVIRGLGAWNFKVKVHGEFVTSIYTITDKKTTEIMPQVKLSAGHNSEYPKVAVCIEAPPKIIINRHKGHKRNA